MDEKVLAQMMDHGTNASDYQRWTTHREHLLLVKVNGNHHFIAYSVTKCPDGTWLYADGHGTIVHSHSDDTTLAGRLIDWF